MTVRQYRFHGTRQELEALLKIFPAHKTDRVLEKIAPIFRHMCDALGVEVCEMCISKQAGATHALAQLRDYTIHNNIFPRVLWRISDSHGTTIACNYQEHDPEFPGPMGALCRVYGKSYYNETQEQKERRIASLQTV